MKIDPETLMSTAPGIFAAGDIAFGPRLIISAVADGKKAAEQIDRYLSGAAWKPRPKYVQITVLDHHQMAANFDAYSRLPVPIIPLERRTGIAEVESGYTEEQARLEASRCLRCWVNTIFEGNEKEGTECILCGGCVDVCPEKCLELVSLDRISFEPGAIHHIRDNQECFGVEFDEISADELGLVTGSAMLKDETSLPSKARSWLRMKRSASVVASAPSDARPIPLRWKGSRYSIWIRKRLRQK